MPFGAMLLVLTLCLCASPGRAQPASGEGTAVYAVVSADPARRAELETQAARWLAEHGARAERLGPVTRQAQAAAVEPAALGLLASAEQALLRARELAAGFDERGALRVLHGAEQTLLGALALPGVHAFLAEIYLQLGLCAAQLGEHDLAETALARAISLDPRRRIQAAEAPPSVVAEARAIERALEASAPAQVRIEVEPRDAQLWLDDRPLGLAPRQVEVASGLHLLAVRAPGYAPYAALLELGPGARAPVRVVLSPSKPQQARDTLISAQAAPARAPGAARALSAATGAPVWLFEAGAGPLARALVYRCTDAHCALEGGVGASPELPRDVSEDDARRWLLAAPTSGVEAAPRERAWWQRWPVWTATAAAVVAAGVVASVALTRDQSPRRARELTVDPGLPNP